MTTSRPLPPACATVVALVLLALGAGAAALERGPADVLQYAELRRSPGDRSAVVGDVSAGDAVVVLEVRGDQARVEAGNDTGWMPVHKLAAAGESEASDSGGLGGLLRGLTGAIGGSGRSSRDASRPITVGVRGLQSEDLANATPDMQAVERLEAWRATPGDGLAYGNAAGLGSRDVEYVEASP